MKVPTVKCEVLAHWETFTFYRTPDGSPSYRWVRDTEDELEVCRASITPGRVTVWRSETSLRCHIRRGKGSSRRDFRHNWRDRYGDLRRIVFTVPNEVQMP